MNKIKKTIYFINKNIIMIVIFFFLVVIFIQNNKLAYKIYYIVNLNYDQRLGKGYEKVFYSGYCEKQSHGYLIYIKNNFNHKFLPSIINFEKGKRIPVWIFQNFNLHTTDKKLVLLNYDKSFANQVDFSKYKVLDNYKNRCFFLEKND